MTDADALRWAMNDAIVEMAHPGWKETARSVDYRRWLPEQPLAVRMLAYSTSTADAIELFRLFKQGNDNVKDNREREGAGLHRQNTGDMQSQQ